MRIQSRRQRTDPRTLAGWLAGLALLAGCLFSGACGTPAGTVCAPRSSVVSPGRQSTAVPTPISSTSLRVQTERPGGLSTPQRGPLILPANGTGAYFVVTWSIADPDPRYCIVVALTTGPDHG